jgi:HEPN domain-containing protein
LYPASRILYPECCINNPILASCYLYHVLFLIAKMKTEEHIQFWVDSAENDLDTAEKLFAAEKFDWCLFLGHLVLEKVLKAHYVKDNENQMPPRIHNLVKLAEKTQIVLSDELKETSIKCLTLTWRCVIRDIKGNFKKNVRENFVRKNF